jgi:hypothetical protein
MAGYVHRGRLMAESLHDVVAEKLTLPPTWTEGALLNAKTYTGLVLAVLAALTVSVLAVLRRRHIQADKKDQ